MTVSSEQLSAYLDGELPSQEMQAVERALEESPALRAELESFMAADAALGAHFEAQLRDAVPIEMAQAIEQFEAPVVANSPMPPKRGVRLAALSVVAALLVGGVGGVFLGKQMVPPVTQVAARGWLDDIADYHRVYADQERHLVEVPAAQAAHIETWLTNTVGTPVVIPDLTAQGLVFESGRLLVAAGKPVAQLMYTDALGAVVALCLIRSDAPLDGVKTRQIGEFDLISWGAETANFVLVGDKNRTDLPQIADRLTQEL